jgi:hypothetical protein
MEKRGILFILLAVLTGAVLSGQEKAASANQLAFAWDVRIGAPEENRKFAEIIARSAGISFERKGFSPLPAGDVGTVLPGLDRSRPAEETIVPKMAALAKEQGSNFLVVIGYYVENDNTFLEVRGWDLAGGKFYDFKQEARSGLELYNRLNDALGALAVKADTIKGVTPDTTPKTERVSKGYVQQIVVLSGDEGAEIYVNGVMRVGVITDGRLALPFMPLNLGTKLVIEKRREGYYSDTEEFRLDEEWVELPLRPMERQVSHELAFIYTLGQFLGFGAGWHYHIAPRTFFLGAEEYFYLQVSDSTNSHAVVHNDLRVLAGMYLLNTPGVAFKVALSTGAGFILTLLTIPPYPLYTDFYFNLINITVEFKIGDLSFYVREETKLGLGIGDNLLGGGFYLIRGEIPIFSFGAKIPLT